jgi:hypothetical protein
MSKLFLCLLFILTNSVMANASPLNNDLGITRIDPNTWKTTHAGELELDGIPVVAALQMVETSIELPAQLANNLQTLVPLNPVQKKYFRLIVAAVEKPSLRAQFELEGQTVSVDGVTRYAYLSKDSAEDFQFLIVAEKNGTLRATYTRGAGSQAEQGEFILAPLAQIL